MKKLILIVLVFSSFCLKAQKKDSLIINVIPSMGKGDPVYVLDGNVITKEQASKIKSDDIVEFGLVKGEDGGKTLYGEKGKNGVVTLTSKKVTPPDTLKIKGPNPLFLVDGKKLDKAQLAQITPSSIESITVIKDSVSKAQFGPEGVNGVVLITTRAYAIQAYKEKFSTLSDDYESYLTSHSADDKAFIYVINDVAVPKDKDETSKVYAVSKKDLESVTFVQDQPEGSKIAARVMIVTKK